MSLIGRSPINLPEGVNVELNGSHVKVTGKLGSLELNLSPKIKITLADKTLTFERSSDTPADRSLHGLTRALVNNLVLGVTTSFERKLELVGTGYRVSGGGQALSLSVGYSHPVEIKAPQGISFELEGNNKITVKGIDKHLVGQVAANIRKVKPPEPYNGKGIRYQGEQVRRKAGKAAKVGGA